MKTIFRAKVVAGIALALGVIGCGDITGMNHDPDAPTDAPMGPLFTLAAVNTTSRWLGGFSLRGMEWMAQHLAEVSYPNEDRYSRMQGSDTQGTFNGAYTGELANLGIIIRKAKETNQPAFWGPAQVLSSFQYMNLTDMWGDVPFTESLQADAAEAVLKPKYDKQQDIYNAQFQLLADAVDAMAAVPATGVVTLGSADPIYGGKLLQWQRLANSLRARMAMRIVNVDPTKADAELKAAFNAPGGVMQADADLAKLIWPGDGTYDNPWAGNFQGRDDHRMSRSLMEIIVGTNDPRVPIFAQKVESPTVHPGGYGGMPNGLSDAGAAAWSTTASRPGAIFYGGAQSYNPKNLGSSANLKTPSYIFTLADVLFIQAEAAERGIGGLNAGQAKGFYDAAISASMRQWGVAAAAINTFLGEPEIAYKGGVDGLKQIATQRWVALYTDGPQAWSEWRRTCQPTTPVAGPEAMVDFIPRRLQYSITESSANKANVDAAVAQMGGPDNFETRMWWDTKPTTAPTYEAGNPKLCTGTP